MEKTFQNNGKLIGFWEKKFFQNSCQFLCTECTALSTLFHNTNNFLKDGFYYTAAVMQVIMT